MKKQHNYALNEVTRFDTIKEMLEIAEREAGDKTAFKYRTGGETVEITASVFIWFNINRDIDSRVAAIEGVSNCMLVEYTGDI
jgi:hypothetical protein